MTTPLASDVMEIEKVFKIQKEYASQLRHTKAKERIQTLKRLSDYILQHQKDIERAIYADFKKPADEAALFELYNLHKDIKFCIKHLSSWMKAKTVHSPLVYSGTRSQVYIEPKGAALIIAPWNYPFYLAVAPLVYAIAAGCTVSLKPSEMTPHTSAFIVKMVEDLFDKREVAVWEGGVEVSQKLLNLKFDHIYFTGSPVVGKIIMEAAAKNLTSVTLELGGKSPVIVDKSADLKDAATKIVWGKCINAGQICISPDYLLVHESQKDELVRLLEEGFGAFYNTEGKGIKHSSSYTRIVNHKHYQRILRLIEDAKSKGAKVVGGETDETEDFIAPTLLTDLSEDMLIMEEEIFGPVLPILTYSNLENALQIVGEKEKPLAFYIFSKDKKATDYILQHSTAGSTCVNNTLIQFANPNLPFGGVNHSGIGKAHGYDSFLEFSNRRSVVKQGGLFNITKLLHPPYRPATRKLVDFMIKWL